MGQIVGAAVVLAPNANDSHVSDVLRAARSELADYKVPAQVKVVDGIPRNTMTKVNRRAVAAMIQTAASTGAGS